MKGWYFSNDFLAIVAKSIIDLKSYHEEAEKLFVKDNELKKVKLDVSYTTKTDHPAIYKDDQDNWYIIIHTYYDLTPFPVDYGQMERMPFNWYFWKATTYIITLTDLAKLEIKKTKKLPIW